jgi:hypothetical protein
MPTQEKAYERRWPGPFASYSSPTFPMIITIDTTSGQPKIPPFIPKAVAPIPSAVIATEPK